MCNTPVASIIIRCYQEAQHIEQLLEGIAAQTVKNVEIIVVDSGSTDDTVRKALRYPVQVLHIRPDEFTFGRALNLGCEAARGRFLVFTSAHVYPKNERWLESLLSPFENPKVALVYGKQRGNRMNQFSEHQIFAKQFPDQSDFEQKTPFCNNANCALRRTLWEQRHYDETLTGLEDVEWAVWALRQGYLIVYSAEAEIVHVHNESRQKILDRYRREAIALKRILPHSHLSIFEFVHLLIANVMLDALRALRQRKPLSTYRDIVVFRTTQYWGTFIGLRFKDEITREMMLRFYYPHGVQLWSSSNTKTRKRRG